MQRLAGRAALITGGSRGIGRAVALRLASEGANIAISYVRDSVAAEAVQSAVREMGSRCEIYRADVSDQRAAEAMCDQAVGDFGGSLNILISNAGVGASTIERPTFTETTQEQWHLLLGTNLWGPIFICRRLIPHFRRFARSDVVMMSSIAAQLMGPRMGAYSVSKAGLEALAHTLAKEERQHGMRVNIVAPGLVDTDMGRNMVRQLTGHAEMNAVDKDSPFGFVCTAEDIAATVAHLCSEDGRYITDQRISIDGGAASFR